MRTLLIVGLICLMGRAGEPGFRTGPQWDEQVREEWHDGCRVIFNLSKDFDSSKPVRLVIYATPNGNTIEETLGCEKTLGGNWRNDIQHVAAQVRVLRQKDANIALAVVEAQGLSWPSYRAKFKDNADRIRMLVEGMMSRVQAKNVRVTLTGHSGGGSFTSGFLNAYDAIPDFVELIAYLDSNYSVTDEHCDKMHAWLKAGDQRKLVVVAYDDREITFDGKKVVSADGGTWRGSDRMVARLGTKEKFEDFTVGHYRIQTALKGRITVVRHINPENKILHTALVGDMNGVMFALTDGGDFDGSRRYTKWIQAAPGIAARMPKTLAGRALAAELAMLPKDRREERIGAELLAGNLPEFLRQFVTVSVKRKDAAGKEHSLSFDVMPDYLSLGTDADFLRMPMTPRTAMQAADAFGCVLPTPLMVNLIHDAASVKLEPKPLGEPRESIEQFLNHHTIIEGQRPGKLGALVSGIKKDIVWSNRIIEKPHRLALYGWNGLDGKVIQPLTIVHVDHYVDYSHGARMVKRTIMLDGKPKDIRDIVRDANLASLLSDEGVLKTPGYE